jgi:hypothetical protein
VKPLLGICLLVVSVFPESNFYKTINIGAAAAVGFGYDNVFIAPAGGIDLNYKVYKYIGIGTHLDYSWFAARNRLNYDYFNVGAHFFDLAFVPRGYVPIDEKNELFFEVDPAVAFTYAYLDYVDFSQTVYRDEFFLSDFGMTYGFGVSMRFFTAMCKIKMVYFKNSDNDYDTGKYQAAHWIMLTIGVPLAG